MLHCKCLQVAVWSVENPCLFGQEKQKQQEKLLRIPSLSVVTSEINMMCCEKDEYTYHFSPSPLSVSSASAR